MLLFDTLTAAAVPLKPIADPVTLYVCGVTPYDTTHLGHARTYLIFDVLQRYLMQGGHRIRYVQNVTDVDDPLFERARQLGVDYRDLAERYMAIFHDDLRTMNIMEPAVNPRVTQEIPHIIATVERLLERDAAYRRDPWVFFRASRFPGYGAMSRLDRDGMLSANKDTGEDPEHPLKEDSLDFRLWQPSGDSEPAWDSPWGRGRPGWHIECTAMANHHLGPRIDVHGGGADLIFPHHSSEIAQSESASGEHPFVRHWVHVGLVWMDGEKMSKSLGNLAFVRDLAPRYGADALRAYLLAFPYRERLDYVENELARAATRWDPVRRAAQGPAEGTPSSAAEELASVCLAALDDDLDTPRALDTLRRLAELVLRTESSGDRGSLASLLGVLGFGVTARTTSS